MDTREILVGARKLLEDPAKWIKGAYGRGGCYCLVGALHAACSSLDDVVGDAIASLNGAILQKTGRFWSAIPFNDSKRTTHADVLSVLDLAIAKAGAQS